MMLDVIVEQESIREIGADPHVSKGRMLAYASQASDEHPPHQTPQPEPIIGVGDGAGATVVYGELCLLSRSPAIETLADVTSRPVDGSVRKVGDPILPHCGRGLARGRRW
jgi:hypothetical protein